MTERGGAPAPLRIHLVWDDAEAVPGDPSWLTSGERTVLAGFRVPKRSRDWQLGRWVAKRAVLLACDGDRLDPRQVEVVAADTGAPVARILATGTWPTPSLSLSHSDGTGLAVACVERLRLGCDLERIAPRTEALLEDYLTDAERAWVRSAPQARDERATLVWAAKESALKALGEGLRLDTKWVEASPGSALGPGADWGPVTVSSRGGDRFQGWWATARGFAWAVVADRPLERPAPVAPGRD